MIDKKDLTLKRAMDGTTYLYDDGFGRELKKIRALGQLINFAGSDDGIVFQLEEVRPGICYILEDIARDLEEGLDHVSREIIDKMSTEARAKEEEPLPPGMRPVKTF